MKYHRTAITRKVLSRPAKWVADHLLLQTDSVLDYGCGRGGDVERLRERGTRVIGYDPSGRFARKGGAAEGPFDLVLCSFVLNVVHDVEERERIRQEVLRRVRPGGWAVFAVRRDIPRTGTQTQAWVEPPARAAIHVQDKGMCLWTEPALTWEQGSGIVT
jgi:SAM-dependent methyltransferase